MRASPAVVCGFLAFVAVTGCSETSRTPTDSQDAPTISSLTRDEEAELIAEYDDRYVSCMEGEGIAVTRISDQGGGWEFDFSGLERDAFEAISASCFDAAGDPPPISPPTRTELAALYDLNISAKECLEGEGANVSEPPSREVWIESYLDESSSAGPWTPYGPGMLSTFGAACPQPDLYDIE